MVFNFRQILRILSYAIMILAISMVFPLMISIYHKETACISAFIITISLLFIISFIMLVKIQTDMQSLHTRDGFLTVSLCWILVPLASTLPFLISGAIPNFADAFFECSSGFTTTGSSILSDVESLPRGLQFWRSFGHWLGGMGILVFAIALLPSLGINGLAVISAESPGPTMDKVTPRLSDTAKMLYFIYIGMTVLQILLLHAGGMGLFDSFIYTFGSVGTGGFSNYNNSVSHFNSTYVNVILSIFMTMAGINFTLYYYLLRGQWKRFFKDTELRVYLLIIIASTLISALVLRMNHIYGTIGESLDHALFQVTTIITTTGFATADTNAWPTTCKVILIMLMVTGGCAASTSGGIKVIRVVVLFKLIRRGIYKKLHPNAVLGVKLGDRSYSSDTVSAIANYLFLYASVFLVGSLLVSLSGSDPVTSFTACLACLSNVGPGFGLVGSMGNFAFFPDWVKILLSFIMIAGRLELFTFLMLFVPSFWNPDR